MCYTIFHIDDHADKVSFFRKPNIAGIKRLLKNKISYLNTTTYKISNQQELDNYNLHNGKFNITVDLKYGEIGCLASNYNAWKSFLSSNYDVLVIIEDDAILLYDYVDNLNKYLNEVPSDFDILSLYVSPGKQFKYDSTVHGIELDSICLGYQNQSTLSYAVSKAGARKLANYVDIEVNAPLDLFIYDKNKDTKFYCIKPSSIQLYKTDTLDEHGEVIRKYTTIQDTEYVDG